MASLAAVVSRVVTRSSFRGVGILPIVRGPWPPFHVLVLPPCKLNAINAIHLRIATMRVTTPDRVSGRFFSVRYVPLLLRLTRVIDSFSSWAVLGTAATVWRRNTLHNIA